MAERCDGGGILWLKPGNPKTLAVCPGCKNCRDVTGKAFKNSKPLTKREKEALIAGGFRRKDLKISLNSLIKCGQTVNSSYVDFLKDCFTVSQVAEIFSFQREDVASRLESDPPGLLGLKFQSHWLLPPNQFHQGTLVPNFEKVLAVLYKPAENALAISSWFGLVNVDLQTGDRTLSPREWLISGRSPKRVLRIAETLHIGP